MKRNAIIEIYDDEENHEIQGYSEMPSITTEIATHPILGAHNQYTMGRSVWNNINLDFTQNISDSTSNFIMTWLCTYHMQVNKNIKLIFDDASCTLINCRPISHSIALNRTGEFNGLILNKKNTRKVLLEKIGNEFIIIEYKIEFGFDQCVMYDIN